MRTKLLLTALLMVGQLDLSAQDGIARWINRDSVDAFISLFNSAPEVRLPLADTLARQIWQQGELRTGYWEFVLQDNLVRGELFLSQGSSWQLWDFYVDEVIRPDGTYYRAVRWPKPSGPEERYLQQK